MKLRVGRAAATLAVVAGGALLAAPAVADDPIRMASRVVDVTSDQVAAGREDDLLEAADEVVAATDFDLWTVYVDSFDGMRPVDWANETAVASDADSDVLLLAVAVDDADIGLSVAEDAPITDAQVSDLEAAVRGEVARGRWVEASFAAADFLVALGEDAGAGSDDDGPVAAGGGGGSIWPWLIGGAVLLVVVVAVARRRRKATGTPEEQQQRERWAGVSLEELGKRAGSALVELDNDVRSSANELAFAEAQFGIEATRDFKATLATAQQQLGQAFTIQQQLEQASSDEQRRQGLAQILTICEQAEAALDSQTEALAELRALQDRAPALLDELDQRAGELEARVPAARDVLRQLGAVYPETALATVAKAPDQAQALVASARQSVAEGRSRVQADDRGTAVAFARTAEDALQQVAKLLDMVGDAGQTLADAAARLDDAIASLTADIADAGRLAPGDATLAPTVERAQAAVAAGAAAKTGGDPIAALAELEAAEQAIDAALAPRREQEQVVARATQRATTQITSAETAVRQANDYIETHRGVVESAARTRLASAVDDLAQARSLQGSDPQQALAAAQRASESARTALSLAQADVSRWRRLQETSQGGGYYGRSGGIDADSMILGGIIGSVLSGGSRSRSTWGGSTGSWGGGTPSRSGWGSGGRRTGSIGGSSGVRRPSGGGSRRSGGGRRR